MRSTKSTASNNKTVEDAANLRVLVHKRIFPIFLNPCLVVPTVPEATEEPPPNTLFLLVAENEELILPTILSRCQIIRIPAIENTDIEKALNERAGLDIEKARQIALVSEGNYHLATELMQHNDEDWQSLLRQWLNAAIKGTHKMQQDWINDIHNIGREKQKQFLKYFSSYALSTTESGNAGDEVEVTDTMNIANLKIQDIIVGNDGNIFIACEQFYTTSSANSDRSAARDFSRFVSPNDAAMRDWYYQRFQTGEKLAYHYEDIYAIKLQASGKVGWIRKIPKRQNSQYIKYGYYEPGHPYTGSMSFKLMADSAGYYFLLVDNEKNVNLATYESPGIHLDGFGGQLMVAKLDQKGKITKEILFDTKSEDIDVYPTEFDQINNNQFIGRAKAKKDTFVPLIITVK